MPENIRGNVYKVGCLFLSQGVLWGRRTLGNVFELSVFYLQIYFSVWFGPITNVMEVDEAKQPVQHNPAKELLLSELNLSANKPLKHDCSYPQT